MDEHVSTCDKPIADCWACSEHFGLVPYEEHPISQIIQTTDGPIYFRKGIR